VSAMGGTSGSDGEPARRQAERLKNRRLQAHIPVMEAFMKIGLLATLAGLTFGVLPDRRKGAVLAVGTCVAMALVLHFVSP
jgi:hypothetical protein